MECMKNVWSRAARRRMARGVLDTPDNDDTDMPEDNSQDQGGWPVMAVRITCEETVVQVRWLRGNNGLLFESFCGMLRNTIKPSPILITV